MVASEFAGLDMVDVTFFKFERLLTTNADAPLAIA